MKKQSRKLLRFLFVIAGCLSMSTLAFSKDFEKGQTEATVLVGFLSGIGTHSTIGVTGAHAISNRVSLYGEYSYIPLGSENITVLGVQTKSSEKAFTLDFGGQFQFKSSGKLQPYGGLGIGLLHVSSNSSVSSSIAGVNLSGGSSGTNAVAKFGGGARYYLTERLGLKPELMIFAGHKTFGRLSGGMFYQFGK